MIPRRAVQDGEARELQVTLRRRAHERQAAVFGHDDEVARREQDLSVPVAAAFPLHLSGGGVETREDGFVAALDESAVMDRARELVLHAGRAPHFARVEMFALAHDLDQRRAGAIA